MTRQGFCISPVIPAKAGIQKKTHFKQTTLY